MRQQVVFALFFLGLPGCLQDAAEDESVVVLPKELEVWANNTARPPDVPTQYSEIEAKVRVQDSFGTSVLAWDGRLKNGESAHTSGVLTKIDTYMIVFEGRPVSTAGSEEWHEATLVLELGKCLDSPRVNVFGMWEYEGYPFWHGVGRGAGAACVRSQEA